MKKIIILFTFLLPLIFTGQAFAADAFWNQCGSSDGSIVRCQTYDCPQGDTNSDGRCTLDDTSAKLQEAKNDAFCANPASGCGEVLYFSANNSKECAIRVKETQTNCDLYKASNPNFSPSPSPTVRPTSAPAVNSSAHFVVPSSSPVPTKTLPNTGAALWVSMAIASIGVYGLYIAERGKN